MKVLICGSRDWVDRGPIERELRKLPGGTIVVHGAARGADTIAGDVAHDLGFEVRRYPADWEMHGKSAGPIRNALMLMKEHLPEEPIDLLLAFSRNLATSRGTLDMIRQAKSAGVPRRLGFTA